jgi:hypothetical protein
MTPVIVATTGAELQPSISVFDPSGVISNLPSWNFTHPDRAISFAVCKLQSGLLPPG